MEQKGHKKRTLRNIRKHFVHKKPETDQDLDTPLLKTINDGNPRMIDTSIGLVEKDRKIFVGVRYLNPFVKINRISIDKTLQKQAVTLSFETPENHGMMPWEYNVKRLESYGDLDLATWGSKIKTFHAKHREIMNKYFEYINSSDPHIIAEISRSRQKAILTGKQIESNYAYKKVTLFLGKAAPKLISTSYSEDVIKQIGHPDLESFISDSKENGIPTLFKGDCLLHLDIGKKFLECASLNGNASTEWPECSTFLYDKNGNKHKISAQLVGVVHPTPEGILLDGYMIINNKYSEDEVYEGEKRLIEENNSNCRKK